MSAYFSETVSAVLRRCLGFVSAPQAALPICYAAGLAAARALGEGGGHTVLAIGAPVAVGMLLRLGRTLTASDIASLAAANVAVATLHGDGQTAWLASLAHDLVEIGCGSLVFLAMRRNGVIRSELGMAVAAGAVALIGPLAAAPVDLAFAIGSPFAALGAVAIRAVADMVAMALILGIVLTYGRGRELSASPDVGLYDKKPQLWEYAASALVVAALTFGAIDGGGPMSTVAASVALLWFALRLGPFATTVAAFAFSCALLAFSGEGRWPVMFDASGPVEAEILRYLSLLLLAAPSVVVAAVIYDQKRQKRLFAYRAMHDGLTTLANRVRFAEVLEDASVGARTRGKRFALLLVDLDHFKTVNDTYGHARGDKLLVEVANRLRQSVRVTDVVARIGGDEFAIMAPISTVADAIGVAKRLVETVNQVCELEGVTLRPSITVGGVLSPDSTTDPEHLMELADQALYTAKAAGRNCWSFSSGAEVQPSARWSPSTLEQAAETVYLE